tara:strand:+ start:520 stop:807 length:288 start_codon:yes stop_codon:yes gene_type:complete
MPLDSKGNAILYVPFKSRVKNKKYSVYVKADNKKGYKKISYGDVRYQQFRDSTKLKLYKNLDHNDPKRKKNYFQRHGRTTDKNTALYWANKTLWT